MRVRLMIRIKWLYCTLDTLICQIKVSNNAFWLMEGKGNGKIKRHTLHTRLYYNETSWFMYIKIKKTKPSLLIYYLSIYIYIYVLGLFDQWSYQRFCSFPLEFLHVAHLIYGKKQRSNQSLVNGSTTWKYTWI